MDAAPPRFRATPHAVPGFDGRMTSAPTLAAQDLLPPARDAESASWREKRAPAAVAPLRWVRTPLNPDALDERLVHFLDPAHAAAAEIRVAADALLVARPENRRVLVVSPHAHAGRTLTTLNLAGALAHGGSRVTVVDVCWERPGVATALGLSSPPEAGLIDRIARLAGSIDGPIDVLWIADQLTALPYWSAAETPRPPGAEGATRRAPASRAWIDAWLRDPAAQRVLERLAEVNDLVLLDGPSVLAAGARSSAPRRPEFTALLPLVGSVLLIVSPADLATGAYESCVNALEGVALAGVVVNAGAGVGVMPARRRRRDPA